MAGEPKDVMTWYRSHGDERPQRTELENGLKVLYGTAPPADFLLTGADMSIDLAVRDPNKCDEHLAISAYFLETVIRRVLWAKEYDPVRFPALCPSAIEAAFRRSELTSWRQAAREEEIKVSFPDTLKAFMFTKQFASQEQAQCSRLESVLPLLGARALEAGKKFGYVSRRALVREDKRYNERVDRTINFNWDCGVFLQSPVVDFDNPTRKLQIKKSRPKTSKKHSIRYERAGIASIYARRYNFEDIEHIGAICLSEWEAKENSEAVAPTMEGSDELDHITNNLFNRCQEPVTVNRGSRRRYSTPVSRWDR